MLKTDLYNIEGKIIGDVELPESVFGAKAKNAIMAQALRVYLANQSQGTVSSKTRGDVSGGGKKMWQQKGTGHARQGSRRAPHWKGGGVAFGPKPRDLSLKMPKKMKKIAVIGALTSKYDEKAIKVIDEINSIEPKTKILFALFNKISPEVSSKRLLILPTGSDKVRLAARNLGGVEIRQANLLNVFDIINAKELIFAKESISVIENNLKTPIKANVKQEKTKETPIAAPKVKKIVKARTKKLKE